MVITVLGIIAAMGASIITEGGRAYSQAKDTRDALAEAQYALQRFSLELANLASSSSIAAMSSSSITFSASGSTVTFAKSGTTLLRNSEALATGVSSFTLTCYRSDGGIAAAPADVRRIAVSISVTRGAKTASLRTEVFPRALRTAYVSWQEE